MLQLLRERPRPFIYAVAVHLALIAILVFSLDWAPAIKPSTARKPAPVQAVVVDGAKLDAEVQRKKEIETQKQREAEEKKRREEEARASELKRKAEEKRAAEVKRERELEAKRKAEAEKKAAAEKKRKAEAERKRKEQEEARKKAEAEKKRQEEARKKAEAEKKRQEEARKAAEAEKKRKEEEARRKAAEAEMQARLAAEQERLAAQRQSAMQRMIDEYVLYIKEKVQRSWIRPPLSGAELSCTVEVRLIPSGEVIDAKIVRSSGNAPFDRSVETAVFKASPLPVPPDAEVMEQFRTLRFEFKPGAA